MRTTDMYYNSIAEWQKGRNGVTGLTREHIFERLDKYVFNT